MVVCPEFWGRERAQRHPDRAHLARVWHHRRPCPGHRLQESAQRQRKDDLRQPCPAVARPRHRRRLCRRPRAASGARGRYAGGPAALAARTRRRLRRAGRATDPVPDRTAHRPPRRPDAARARRSARRRSPAPPPAPPPPEVRVPSQANPPAAAASLDATTLPAAAEADTLLQVTRAGRFAVALHSKTGAALQLVDMLTGPSELSGEAGAQDGRLDLLLDEGTYKLRSFSAPGAGGEVGVSASAFRDAAPPRALPPPGQLFSAELHDLEQRAFWLVGAALGRRHRQHHRRDPYRGRRTVAGRSAAVAQRRGPDHAAARGAQHHPRARPSARRSPPGRAGAGRHLPGHRLWRPRPAVDGRRCRPAVPPAQRRRRRPGRGLDRRQDRAARQRAVHRPRRPPLCSRWTCRRPPRRCCRWAAGPRRSPPTAARRRRSCGPTPRLGGAGRSARRRGPAIHPARHGPAHRQPWPRNKAPGSSRPSPPARAATRCRRPCCWSAPKCRRPRASSPPRCRNWRPARRGGSASTCAARPRCCSRTPPPARSRPAAPAGRSARSGPRRCRKTCRPAFSGCAWRRRRARRAASIWWSARRARRRRRPPPIRPIRCCRWACRRSAPVSNCACSPAARRAWSPDCRCARCRWRWTRGR